MIDPRPWAVDAACVDEPIWLFFPVGFEPPDLALAVCDRCPVREDCLEHALARREDIGVWGGTTEAEPRQLRRQAQEAASW